MKYINQTTEQLDNEINQMFDLQMPNSAFKRVIPTEVKSELRTQYIEFLESQTKTQEFTEEVTPSRPVSTQVIKVNISSLKEAGYCCCPVELAAACEQLIREQKQTVEIAQESEVTSDLNNLIEGIQSDSKKYSSEVQDAEMDCETLTTNSKSNEASCDNQHSLKVVSSKTSPAKLGSVEGFKQTKKISNQQTRTSKRKYFTKYMSNEFSKDTKLVNMAEMDSKTQRLFQDQDFNELVSEITGIN
jgi:type II secretory pathway pseudopilin PulG